MCSGCVIKLNFPHSVSTESAGPLWCSESPELDPLLLNETRSSQDVLKKKKLFVTSCLHKFDWKNHLSFLLENSF